MWLRLLLTAVIASSAWGASCKSPKHSASFYTTTDAFFHFSTTYIVEFVLNCNNDVEDMPVYAVVAGKEQAIQAAVSEETTKYQVSWQEEHENAHAATIKVDLFDEDGYSAYRKAQRNNEDSGKVKPLFSVDVKHPVRVHRHLTISHLDVLLQGVSKGQYIASETVVTILAAALFYVAYSLRSTLQS